MIISTTTTRTHAVKITAPTETPFVIGASISEDKIALETLMVKIVVEADNTVRPLDTFFEGRGYRIKEDGTVSKAVRNVSGGNLNRLPDVLRDAILAEADRLGVVGLREDLTRLAALREKR